MNYSHERGKQKNLPLKGGFGSGGGDRTPDTWIMIPPLYQLSYSAIMGNILLLFKAKVNKKLDFFEKICYLSPSF